MPATSPSAKPVGGRGARPGSTFAATADLSRPDVAVRAAGIAFVTPDRRLLLMRRQGGDHPGEWALPAGHIEAGETARQAAVREAIEETGTEIFLEAGPLRFVDRRTSADGVDFATFAQAVVEPFEPVMSDEHSAFTWAPFDDLPNPLHPGLKVVLGRIATDGKLMLAQDRIAFRGAKRTGGWDASPIVLAMDRAETVRSYGRDGHLHVARSHISKAAVNPYLGKEIPGWRGLGLEPGKIYQLYRDPEELAKGAPTFNNLPVLSKHVPVTSAKHPKDLVVGSTGTDATFDGGFLDNSLVFWPQDAISDVENEVKRDLSSAYHYRADMTPGRAPDGTAYDGVMRDIVGNHVAAVKEGRAGDDVIVGDSMENITMSKSVVLSRKAALLQGAMLAFLTPKLAQDAKLDLTPILKGVTSKNFKAKKPAIIRALEATIEGNLAEDASIEGLVELLDAVGGVKTAEAVDELNDNSGSPVKEVVEKEAMDDDPMAKVKAFLKGKISDEDLAKIDEIAGAAAAAEGAEGAEDEPPPFKDMPKLDAKTAKDAIEKEVKEKTKDMVTKPAMDAAVSTAVKAALATAKEDQKLLREAEKAVRPYVGELAMAHDSAEEVYRTALGALGVKDIEEIPAAALPHILAAQPLPNARRVEPRVAMDAAGAKSYAERFPGADKIGRV